MTTAYFLRFTKGTYSAPGGTYGGTETYGENPFTFGQQASDSTQPTTRYDLLPSPGFHPQTPGWEYRVGDESLFSCSLIESGNPSNTIDLSTVDIAELILTEYTFENLKSKIQTFLLTINTSTNALERVWLPEDLVNEGIFRVNVRLLFNSGRYLTAEANDQVLLQINSAPGTP